MIHALPERSDNDRRTRRPRRRQPGTGAGATCRPRATDSRRRI